MTSTCAQPPISIVVPSYNRRASLQRLLDALASQSCAPGAFEVIVVDDGSTDDTVQFVRSLETSFRLTMLEQSHGGPAAARNLGVSHARGELILFLDDDVVPRANLVDEHLRAHTADDDLVVVGPMSPPIDFERPAWVRWEEALLQVQYRDMLAGKYACTPRQFYTANASLPRRRFLEAGGFDTGFARAEDVEFAYRLRDLGARFAFVPQAEVLHYASRSFDSWSRTPYLYGRYDVVMERDKGHEALRCATQEFHSRHLLNQWVVRVCLGRRFTSRLSLIALRGIVAAADHLGFDRLASRALSSIFGLRYWQGVSDELGGPERVWSAIAIAACS